MLSDRKIEILRLAAEGYPMKQIADRLNICRETVHSHMKKIKKQLGAYNTPHAIHIAHQKNIL